MEDSRNASVRLEKGNLLCGDYPLLLDVPENVTVKSGATTSGIQGVFLGVRSSEAKSDHVFPLGTLDGLRFLACFRFKLWWMTQRMGAAGHEIPLETQLLLVENKKDTCYTVLLPLLDGSFRACLQGNEKNEIELCLHSGDPAIKVDSLSRCVYVHSGSNPFTVIKEAVMAAEELTGLFVCREKRKMPKMVEYFGWCTWDAFYRDVTAEGISNGLTTLEEGGTPPGFIIIDDGWQSTGADDNKNMVKENGPEPASTYRLFSLRANHKFQRDGKRVLAPLEEGIATGLGDIVRDAKEKHKLKYVYVWHALTGYWGGVMPGPLGERFSTSMLYPMHTPGILGNDPLMATDDLTVYGLGVVHPDKVFEFFDEMHSYLAAAGVDGVKVDVQGILETLGSGFGGRVALAKTYHEALEKSVKRNFPDNGCISCMSHSSDSVLSSKQTAVVRASDDFWPRDPASHTIHVASVAYNSFFLGEFMQPDWDMFHSLHPAAQYHAAARAVGGSPVYVSDKPGEHDFDLLKKLVLPDRTVLRARLPGRPTRDCLFSDPARDDVSMLKIWNHNYCNGVLGAFNCQGAGWCKVGKKNAIHDFAPKSVTSQIRAADVEDLAALAPEDWDGSTVMFTHRQQELTVLPRGGIMALSLEPLQYEVFTVAPLKRFASGVAFAPVGLTNMFNSGGAVTAVRYSDAGAAAQVEMTVHGCGLFTMYSSAAPRRCTLDGVALETKHEPGSGRLAVEIPVPKEGHDWTLVVEL